MARSGTIEDRRSALHGLGNVGRAAANLAPLRARQQEIFDALQDEDDDVRWSAAIGLGYFGDQAKDAIPALQEAQHDEDARVREAAGVALSRIDPATFPASSKQAGK